MTSPPTFTEVMVADGSGILRRTYDMDRDAFTLLVMGFTGAKALAFKVAYIAEFTGTTKANVLKAADKLRESLAKSKLTRLADGFHEGTYLDEEGKPRRCLDIERDSAIMLINRFTGAASGRARSPWVGGPRG